MLLVVTEVCLSKKRLIVWALKSNLFFDAALAILRHIIFTLAGRSRFVKPVSMIFKMLWFWGWEIHVTPCSKICDIK